MAVLALCLSAILSLFLGSASLSFSDVLCALGAKTFFPSLLDSVDAGTIIIVWQVRLPRTLAALLCGGALSVCGCVYQAVFKNPMADPYVLGISSMGALGATIGIVLGASSTLFGSSIVSLLAFVFALLSVFLVFLLAGGKKRPSNAALLLTGLALGQFATAIVSLLMMLFSKQMKEIVFWTMGSFSAVQFRDVWILLPVFVLCAGLLLTYHHKLDVLSLGEENAVCMGLDVVKTRWALFVLSALLIAVCVYVCGIVGFVGLIAPHIARMSAPGEGHRRLLVQSGFFGAVMMVLCDVLSRILLPSEIPVGIVCAFFGAPFFIWILRKSKGVGVL